MFEESREEKEYEIYTKRNEMEVKETGGRERIVKRKLELEWTPGKWS